jgi:hypothetical protein
MLVDDFLWRGLSLSNGKSMIGRTCIGQKENRDRNDGNCVSKFFQRLAILSLKITNDHTKGLIWQLSGTQRSTVIAEDRSEKHDAAGVSGVPR